MKGDTCIQCGAPCNYFYSPLCPNCQQTRTLNAYAETPAEVVEREVRSWREEQQGAEWDYRIQRMRFRAYMHKQLMAGVGPESLPMPRFTWRDILLSLIGR